MEYPNVLKFKFYREIGSMDFPVEITCTLQGSSVTQGNPVTFTAITFAVYPNNKSRYSFSTLESSFQSFSLQKNDSIVEHSRLRKFLIRFQVPSTKPT